MLITPTEYPELDHQTKVVFLAGPIKGGPDWQATAIEHLHRCVPDLVIANPRREYIDDDFVYDEQVDWETTWLNRAAANGIIMFWLAAPIKQIRGRAYGQTTRAELFEWKVHREHGLVRNLVLGVEEGFSGAKYIHHRFAQDCSDIKIHDTLANTCRDVVKKLGKLWHS